ncbi:MAG: acetyltransferase, partial [Prevotella sp.]|nr:acetyltransferase [Prevotella sp.]
MILYGASGHARVIRDIVEAQDDRVSRLIDD